MKNMKLVILLTLSVFTSHGITVQPTCKPCSHTPVDVCVPCPRKDGSMDITFGNHGLVTTNIEGSDSYARSVVILPCGDIVAVGYSTSIFSNYDFTLIGYTSFGAVKKDFGNDGIVLTDFATVLNQHGASLITPSSDQALAATLQRSCSDCSASCVVSCSDECNHRCDDTGKIVAVGSTNATETGQTAFAMARYNTDGSLDTSFGTGGVVVTPIGSIFASATAVAIQANNKIVVAGFVVTAHGNNFAVARYNCDGTLDTTFGCMRTGIVTIDFGSGGNDFAQAVKIQKNGKIVVAGYTDARGSNDFALVRLTSGGKLDKTFGPEHTGKVITDFSGNGTSDDTAYALVLVEDCFDCCDSIDAVKIIAVGSSASAGTVTKDFALAAYNANGSLDKDFGPDHTGLVLTDFSGNATSDDTAFAATLQKSKCKQVCKIVVAGSSSSTIDMNANSDNFALARYTVRGELDPEFGVGGKVVTSFDGASSTAAAVASECDGDIIAAGRVLMNYSSDFALARYIVCVPCC